MSLPSLIEIYPWVDAFEPSAFLKALLPKAQVSSGFPAGPGFYHWAMGFKQSSFHPVSQFLQQLLG